MRIVGNAAVAEDLTSEVFLNVWRQAHCFKAHSTVSTWLLAIAKHVLGDELDRRLAQKRGGNKKAMELDESWMAASTGDTLLRPAH